MIFVAAVAEPLAKRGRREDALSVIEKGFTIATLGGAQARVEDEDEDEDEDVAPLLMASAIP